MFRAFARAVASWSRDLVSAQSTGPSLLALYLLISGFMITRVRMSFFLVLMCLTCTDNISLYIKQTNIPGWWIWYDNPTIYVIFSHKFCIFMLHVLIHLELWVQVLLRQSSL